MRQIKKTRTREYKDLQFGQQSVQFEEAVWNRVDIVNVQPPERKTVGMRRMKRKTNTREHKDLQPGQSGVIFKRVGIHRCYSHVV